MATKFLGTDPWRRISSFVRRAPRKCQVAVAYLGQGASKMLPLKKGSTLIVDFSDAAIKSRQTNPVEVVKFIKRGVEVHNVSNLHAKVFLIGKTAIIGSMNASRHSKNFLMEAAMETEDKRVVSSCRKWIVGLGGERISLDHAKDKVALYPKIIFAKNRNRGFRKKNKPSPKHSPLWIVPLVSGVWDSKDDEVNKMGKPTAIKRLRSKRIYEPDSFRWLQDSFSRRVGNKHFIMQVVEEDGKFLISPAARYLNQEKYKSINGQRRTMIFLEMPKNSRRKNRRKIIKQLRLQGIKWKQFKHSARLVKDEVLAHGLYGLWNTGANRATKAG
jgi:hypothetical protein